MKRLDSLPCVLLVSDLENNRVQATLNPIVATVPVPGGGMEFGIDRLIDELLVELAKCSDQLQNLRRARSAARHEERDARPVTFKRDTADEEE